MECRRDENWHSNWGIFWTLLLFAGKPAQSIIHKPRPHPLGWWNSEAWLGMWLRDKRPVCAWHSWGPGWLIPSEGKERRKEGRKKKEPPTAHSKALDPNRTMSSSHYVLYLKRLNVLFHCLLEASAAPPWTYEDCTSDLPDSTPLCFSAIMSEDKPVHDMPVCPSLCHEFPMISRVNSNFMLLLRKSSTLGPLPTSLIPF